jgi:Peptidase family S41
MSAVPLAPTWHRFLAASAPAGTFRLVLLVPVLLVSLGWCVTAMADPGTREDRSALFDYILKATMERTAFSPLKPRDLGAGEHITEAEYIRDAMLAHRDEFLAADTDAKLYYALIKLTCARWDGHLSRVRLVEGGIQPFTSQTPEGGVAPIKFKPDYSNKAAMFLFVSDFAKDIGRFADSNAKRAPQLGDKLVGVNGQPADLYLKRLGQFVGKSSHRAFWWDLAYRVSRRTRHIAPSLFDGDRVMFELETQERVRYKLTLPYFNEESIDWAGYDDHYTSGELANLIRRDPNFIHKTHQVALSIARYPGFQHVFSRPAFDLYVSSSQKVFLLQGHSFFPETIVADLDHLMAYARSNKRLDYAVIYDLTRGGGGDFEEYTLQRLQSRPFKIMFGNLRISDVTPPLVQQLRARAIKAVAKETHAARPILARDITMPDNGRYLIDWLDKDVAAAIRAKQAYTNNVQFKNQFLPTTSDGYLYPAEEHFTGPMVLLTAPSSCSGADQFAAMFIDNELGLSVGMPEGGCSNTWEWDETLKFPISGKPVAMFSWSVGHSIRPNGEVLEGNSALPRVYVPLTRDNYAKYYKILLDHALSYIKKQRTPKAREPSTLERITHQRRNP